MNAALSPQQMSIAQSFLKKNCSFEQIRSELQKQNINDSSLNEIINYVKGFRIRKKRNRGFIFTGIGVTLLTLGFLLTMILINLGVNHNLALYGLTSIGIVFVMTGMIDILGW